MTLTEFLIERIAEDEAVARAWREDIGGLRTTIMAECVSARQFVDLHSTCATSSGEARSCSSLIVLGTLYDEHPDYRQEWKP